MVKTLQLVITESQFLLLTSQIQLGGNTKHQLLAMNRWNRRNTDIILLSVYHNRHTAILRLSLLRDIHTAHNLDTGGNSRKQTIVIDHLLIKRTIDTVSDTYLLLQCFYMNITGTLTNGLFNQRPHQLNNRSIADIRLCLFFNPSPQLGTFSCKSTRRIHGL